MNRAPSLPESPFALRDYQEEAIAAIRSAFFERGLNRLLVVHPTGSGKTILFAHLLRDPSISQWIASYPKTERRVLVLAHRKELLEQAAHRMRQVNPHCRIAIEQGHQTAPQDTDVVVASVASLARTPNRLARLKPEAIRLVVIDEAHHAVAKTYRTLLGSILSKHPADARSILIVGLTATPDRLDGVGLASAFDDIVDSRTLRELIDQKVLSDLRAYRVLTAVNLDTVRTTHGDFVESDLARAVNVQERNTAAVSAYVERARGRQAIAFAADVNHALALADAFRSAGMAAAALHGGMRLSDRHRLIEDFHTGRLRVLTNCMLLTEGFDAPQTSCIIQARPTQSRSLYMQMIGRGTRLAAGKTDCVVLDLVDNCRKHRLVTVASLCGLPPHLDLQGTPLSRVDTLVRRAMRSGTPARHADSWSELRVLTQRVPLWDTDRWHCIPSATSAFQVGLGGYFQNRLVAWKRNGRWRIKLFGGFRNEPPFGTLHAAFPIWIPPYGEQFDNLINTCYDTLEDAKAAISAWLSSYRKMRGDTPPWAAELERPRSPEPWMRRVVDTPLPVRSATGPRRRSKRLALLANRILLFLRDHDAPAHMIGAITWDSTGVTIACTPNLSRGDIDVLFSVYKVASRVVAETLPLTSHITLPHRIAIHLHRRGWDFLIKDSHLLHTPRG